MYIFYATGCENGEDPRRQKKGTLFMFALVTFMHEFLSPGRFSSLLVIISHYRQGCQNKLSGYIRTSVRRIYTIFTAYYILHLPN